MTAEPMDTPDPMKTVASYEERYGDLPRCHANSKQTGKQCGQPSIPGGTVCRFHGGAAPNVKARANLRLLELVEPSIGRLARVVATGTDRDAIRAANSLLDRAGVVRRTDIDPAAATALLVERLREIAEQRAHPVVPGSVVDDDTAEDA